MAESSTFYPDDMDYSVGDYLAPRGERADRRQSAAPEWFRLMREAAPELPNEKATDPVEPARASAGGTGAVRQFLARIAESRGALGR